MLVLADKPSFDWPVTVKVPGSDGRHTAQEFTAKFAVLTSQRLESITDLGAAEGDTALVREALIGVKDVRDEAGQSLQWSEELRDQLIAIPYVRIAIVRAYFAAMTGEAARKN